MTTEVPYKTNPLVFRERWIEFIYTLQDTICKGLELIDGKAIFIEDRWEREEGEGLTLKKYCRTRFVTLRHLV